MVDMQILILDLQGTIVTNILETLCSSVIDNRALGCNQTPPL